MAVDLESELTRILRTSPTLMRVLRALRDLALPDWRLFSGAIYQTVWNALTGRPVEYGIKDFDVGYFDNVDLSWEAEDILIRSVLRALPGRLAGRVEVRNQARVHLWFEAKFGEPYAPLGSTDEALTRFTSTAFAVAVRLEPNETMSIAAPFGLEDCFSMFLRPNPTRSLTDSYQRAVASVLKRWPELSVPDE